MKKIISIYKKYSEIINYVIVGGLTTVVSLATYFIFSSLVFPSKAQIYIQISNIISWIFAVTFAYFANRIIVFKSNNKKVSEISKFFLSRISTLLIDMLLMFIFTEAFHISDTISKLIVQVVILVLNYVLSKLFVFKGDKNEK